jgi:PPOX class probable F420-dependent enzyme
MRMHIMDKIPDTHIDLLSDGKKAFLILSTIMPDGTPQVTPVWFNTEGEHILINSARGRIKDRNMRARPFVAMCISDRENPYRYLQIRGNVIKLTTDGADEHIDRLAFKYRGLSAYPNRKPGEQRVKYIIQIRSVDVHG